MSERGEIRIAADAIRPARQRAPRIAVVGGPNTGKSTLFNRLTGLRQRIGNYPGVTVERHTGSLHVGGQYFELIDLPGTHGLSAQSMEEQLAIDVLFGRVDGTPLPDGILGVLDATNLYQGLYLMQQLVDIGMPVLVALTMNDVARREGTEIDVDALSDLLGGAPVIAVTATTGSGVESLRQAIAGLPGSEPPEPLHVWPELRSAASELRTGSSGDASHTAFERLLVDGPTQHNSALVDSLEPTMVERLPELRESLFDGEPPLAVEARVRYRWARDALAKVQNNAPVLRTLRHQVSDFLNRPVPGTFGLIVVMALVFQAVFAWATPMMDLIDGATAGLSAAIHAWLGDGALASLIADGIVAGVGSVVIFLPQILILFTFIILLEDTGYLARAAYLLDRVMRSVGLSGQSIIPMISSFACAVPGIMATRVIPNRRDRIATILAAPFMTCSARLPVYALLIAAFVPAQSIGIFNLQGLVLLGLYLFGIVMGILTALLMRKTALRGPKPPFALMLPEFRRPNLRTLLMQLLGRARVFLYRAGTVIFVVAVIIWALAYYPRADLADTTFDDERRAAVSLTDEGARQAALAHIDNRAAAAQLEQSWLGRAGKTVEPVFRPLGWDWKISAAVIAGFPAREVVVAVLGTVYAVGDEADEATLSERLKSSTWPDGRLVFTLPMVLGLLVFYACCLQCAATLAVIRRETNSWRWPIFAWFYMTTLGYLGALAVYQLGTA